MRGLAALTARGEETDTKWRCEGLLAGPTRHRHVVALPSQRAGAQPEAPQALSPGMAWAGMALKG